METQKGPWIKARLKTHREVTWVYPDAVWWGRRTDRIEFGSADEAVLPYLGKVVHLRKRRISDDQFFFEIKDSGGLLVLPNWVRSFESAELVPPADYDGARAGLAGDTWLEWYEKRFMEIEDILVIHG